MKQEKKRRTDIEAVQNQLMQEVLPMLMEKGVCDLKDAIAAVDEMTGNKAN